MKERSGIVTVGGNPITLVGDEIKVGDVAPDAVLIDNDLKPVNLLSFSGKVCIISVVHSLDTGICNLQTKRFNKEAEKFGTDVVILTISMDLPFAQKRWCGAEGVTNVKTLSDHRDASFGTSYGVLIKELRLLARAIFVIDKDGIIRYTQIVKEVGTEPNYDEVLQAINNLMKERSL
jgi:thioredoxin-dependent peroxiredoxin